MNNGGIVGKFLYFWIFMIGVLLLQSISVMSMTADRWFMFCIAAALLYIVFMVFRALGRNKREEKAEKKREANRTPVHKGQAGKKKKKR